MTFGIPSPKLTSFGAKYNFNAPVPLPRFLYRSDDEDAEDEQEESTATKKLGGGDEEPVQITINSGIVGNIARLKQKVEVTYEDGSTQEIEVRPWLVMLFWYELTHAF